MESQDFNKELIEYLYGEMTDAEKKTFEEKLSNDPVMQKELEELKQMRSDLTSLEEKEVMEPFSIWAHNKSNWLKGAKRRRSVVLTPITAIAASLVLVMLVGYVTNFSVSLNEQGFQMSFVEAKDKNTQHTITEDDIKRILAQEIEKNNNSIFTTLNEANSALNTRISGLENDFMTSKIAQNQSVSNEDLNKFFVQSQDRNTQLLQNYLNQTSTQQQQYFKTMLTEFNAYLQEQRAQDLNVLQTDILELKYSQTQQKLETDQVLAGLISTVSQDEN